MLLSKLLDVQKVAIISGGDWPQFQKQVVSKLPNNAKLHNLSLLPTCGTKFFKFDQEWTQLYAENLTATQKARIFSALENSIKEAGFTPDRVWGEVIEDRGTQVTFSALGQLAPLAEKQKWDPSFSKRKAIKVILDHLIPEYSVRLGGSTSIDVTRPGIDKGYGIGKLRDILGVALHEMIFVGDALFPGGNDYPAKEIGIVAIAVNGPGESRKVIEAIIACFSDPSSPSGGLGA